MGGAQRAIDAGHAAAAPPAAKLCHLSQQQWIGDWFSSQQSASAAQQQLNWVSKQQT
jgi:hypothetical protein